MCKMKNHWTRQSHLISRIVHCLLQLSFCNRILLHSFVRSFVSSFIRTVCAVRTYVRLFGFNSVSTLILCVCARVCVNVFVWFFGTFAALHSAIGVYIYICVFTILNMHTEAQLWITSRKVCFNQCFMTSSFLATC